MGKSVKKERGKVRKRRKRAGKTGDFGKLYYDSERCNAGLSVVKSEEIFSDVQK
ncbi:hypothetical protein WMO40_08430 [Bacillaceae bacterium CLA-AA-H227]|uniref:Uncharacterized protein n=1 Tax=Robertmurraya yapensis (ex Hitch et al 2024) TaxID=3133160 RepID=A0ACC6S9I4_9BACI|nr:hypothetical protein [Bacillus yapensis]